MVTSLPCSAARRLYVPPSVACFGSDGATALVDLLAESENVTATDPVRTVSELTLRDSCTTTTGGYQYTTDGFRQICRLLGPGVFRLIPDLAGTRRRNIPDDFYDGELAIGFFNALVDRRFGAFSPYKLVKNTQTRMIDGLIGQGHRQLNNLAFYYSIEEALQQLTPRPAFYTAMVIGRRLLLWCRATQPFLSLSLDGMAWHFFLGYYFRNDEITGAAARVSLAIFSQAGVCLAPFKQFGARVKHQGRDFTQRLGSELDRVVCQVPPLAEWSTKIAQSLPQNLGFVSGSDSRARHQRLVVIATYLRRAGVDFTMAREIVDAAQRFGRTVGVEPEETEPILQEQSFAARTVVDLLYSLLHLSRQLDTARREILEQAAFSLLIGKLF